MKIDFQFSEDEMKTTLKQLMQDYSAALDKIAAVADGQETWENTFGELALSGAEFGRETYRITLPSQVSSEKSVRDLSNVLTVKLAEFGVECSMRHDVYEVLSRFVSNKQEIIDSRSKEEVRFVKKTMLEYRKLGMNLPQETRAELEKIDKEISELEVKFSQNQNEATASLRFTRDQLDGLPEDWLDSHTVPDEDQEGKKEKKDILIHLKNYPDIFPIRDLCKVAATRKAVEEASWTFLKEVNAPLLTQAIELRQQSAKLRGYEDFSSFMIDGRMAKSRDNVIAFENDLREKLWDAGKREYAELLRLKKSEGEGEGEDELHSYDFYFYHQKNLRINYACDQETVKEYFPTEHVVEQTLEVYQKLLGLHFEKVDDINGARPWNDEVFTYNVKDENGGVMGSFMLDLYPREGKYSHACMIDLIAAHTDRNGDSVPPVAVILANFPKSTKEKPALLPHSDVETLFHEFGHCMHVICSEAKLYRMSGANVEWDFVETPSQCMENYVWYDEVLKKISSHYKTGSPIPDDLISSIIKSRKADVVLLTLRQISLGVFDQIIHSLPEADNEFASTFTKLGLKSGEGLGDLGDLFGKIRLFYSMFDSIPGTYFPSTFGHIMSSYAAGYYGYLFSEVYACDLFETIKQNGVMNPEIGRKYRREILSMGDCEDPMVMMKQFLGREPNMDAFLESKV